MKCNINPQSIGLTQAKAQQAVENLNQYLANLQVLYIKLHNIQWNIGGESFFDIRDKTKILTKEVAVYMNLVAEKIKAFGFFPVGSLQEALSITTIHELPNRTFDRKTAAMILVYDCRQMLLELREIEEMLSSYAGEVIRNSITFFEKYHWMFCSYAESSFS